MLSSKNPVEKRLEYLSELWMQATQSINTRLIVWRIPANAGRMMAAFFEAQKHHGDWNTPDFFLRFDDPYEVSFGYSRDLKETFLGHYAASGHNFKEQGIPQDWNGREEFHPDSATGVVSLLKSFADHHRDHMRYLAVVFDPASCAVPKAFMRWVELALRDPMPSRLRIVLIDTQEECQWQALVKRHADIAKVIETPINIFDIAMETAAQIGNGGTAMTYRQLLTDVMALLERGTAEQVAKRAIYALRLADQLGWVEQKVVLHMAVAGAWVKQGEYPKARFSYQQARECAVAAEAAGHTAGTHLRMQSWFGEAGIWLKSNKPAKAAEAYLQGARAAAEVPDAFFVIEAYRMAGFCYQRARQRNKAIDQYLLAIHVSLPLSAEQRAATTLPLVLQNLLQLDSPQRAWMLERHAEIYQARIAKVHARAESQAQRFGAYADRDTLDRIEAEMHDRFEKAFHRTCQNRERVIARSDELFRRVVAVGRLLLHPTWNGVPEIKHPLDKELPEWSELPQLVDLPNPKELLEDVETTPMECIGMLDVEREPIAD